MVSVGAGSTIQSDEGGAPALGVEQGRGEASRPVQLVDLGSNGCSTHAAVKHGLRVLRAGQAQSELAASEGEDAHRTSVRAHGTNKSIMPPSHPSIEV